MDTLTCHGDGQTIANNKNDIGDAVASCSASSTSARRKRIFTLRAANSFGRDEMGIILTDDGKPLKLTSKFMER